MLRKRSRAAVSKQGSMPGSKALQPPTGNNQSKPAMPSLFPSPRLFSSKGFSDPEVAMSPTSILDNKYFSSIGSFLFSDKNQKKPPVEAVNAGSPTASESRHHHPWADGGSKAIGLGILDALNDDETEKNSSNLQRRMVLFGSKLKIQVPSLGPNSAASVEVAGSPIEFGIKNKDSQLALFSPARRCFAGDLPASPSPRVFKGSIPASEMELSEDYTCVITHGPNPTTTHIFDNCIVESFGDGGFSALRRESSSDESNSFFYASNDFLSSCYACKRHLGEGTDIFMYRGDRAFCSNECRYQEVLSDERSDACSTGSSLTS